jgi:hypothetical protein
LDSIGDTLPDLLINLKSPESKKKDESYVVRRGVKTQQTLFVQIPGNAL